MISLADRPAHDNLSIFQHFESYMGDLFRKVEDIDWMSEKNSKKNMDE